jgi:ribosomal-protein-alanine N-acetyltransferase
MTTPDIFADPPVLRTERLVLRQITESDGEGLFGIFADDEVTEHYAWDTFTGVEQGHELAARTAGQFRQREAIRWGLLLPGSARIIGTCGYTRWVQDSHFAILGYDLARDYWRRGLMSEAVAAVLRLGFEQMALHRVEATVMAGNTASAAVLGRAGFRREGVMRERALKRGEFRDVWMFGLIHAEWLYMELRSARGGAQQFAHRGKPRRGSSAAHGYKGVAITLGCDRRDRPSSHPARSALHVGAEPDVRNRQSHRRHPLHAGYRHGL